MNANPFVGRALALGAAMFYGVNTTLSRLAYDTGTTPVSLTLYRFLISALLMLVLVAALRKSWRLEVPPRLFAVCVFGMFLTSIGHLGAVNYIPVSLSAIIFYTFPLLVVAWKRIAQRQAVARTELAAFILAFLGIGIALGADLHSFDPRGIALAFGGAVGAATFILSYEKFPPQTDSYVATLWIMIASLGFSLLAILSGFEMKPPSLAAGWVYIAAISCASAIAFVLSLQAIARVGGAVFALFLNFEPVIILFLAWIALGEQLSAGRFGGMLLVVFALFLSHWRLPRVGVREARAHGD
jgi:drug/metabolite transporter (DMT)-like permease